MTLCRSPALRVDAYWLTSRPLKWHSLIQRRVHSRRLRGPRTTRATLPRVPDHFSRPKQRPRPQARRCGSAQCQNHFCVKALPARLVGTVKQDMRASEMAGGMLGTVVCVYEDGADARACRSDKLASRFTDSEWSLSTSADLLPWRPGMTKRVLGAAPGAAAYRNRPPAVPGHQGDRPGTPGAASTASDGFNPLPVPNFRREAPEALA